MRACWLCCLCAAAPVPAREVSGASASAAMLAPSFGSPPQLSLLLDSTSALLTAVYMEDFEAPFLERAAQFYAAEAAEFIASCDCPTYLQHAERRLAEEVDRWVLGHRRGLQGVAEAALAIQRC